MGVEPKRLIGAPHWQAMRGHARTGRQEQRADKRAHGYCVAGGFALWMPPAPFADVIIHVNSVPV